MSSDLQSMLSNPDWPSKNIARVLEAGHGHEVLKSFQSLNRTEKTNLLNALAFMYDRRCDGIPCHIIAKILKSAADDSDKTVSFLGGICSKYLLQCVDAQKQSFVTKLQELLSIEDINKGSDEFLDEWARGLDAHITSKANDANSSILPLEAPYVPLHYSKQSVVSHFM